MVPISIHHSINRQGFLPVRFAAPLCMYTPVYPCVPLCTPVYSTPVYSTVPLCTVPLPCVQYPLCTPCVPVCSPCAPMCTPVCPCVPPCTHVYPRVPRGPLCTSVYPCVCTCVPLCVYCTLCIPFVYPCDPRPPQKRKSTPPPHLSSACSSARHQPPTLNLLQTFRGEGGLPAAPLTLGVWVLACFSGGGGRVRGTWSRGDAWARLRGSGFWQKKVFRPAPITSQKADHRKSGQRGIICLWNQ
jgi:hypothetical protein